MTKKIAKPAAKKPGRPKGSRNIINEETRQEFYSLALKNGYEPVIKWVKDIDILILKIKEEELLGALKDSGYIMSMLRLIFDMEKEINAYFLPKLKPRDTQSSEKSSGGIVVNLADPFSKHRNAERVRDLGDTEVVVEEEENEQKK